MPKPAISIKILSSDARVLAGIPKHRYTRRAVARFLAGQEVAARPRPGAGTRPRAPRGLPQTVRKEAAPGLLHGVPAAAPRPRQPRGLRDPSRAVGAERRAGSRPLGQGGKEGESRPRKHPGKDEGGAGKLAASSRPRLRSPLLSCPKSSRLQKIFVCTISWYWS